MRLDFNSFMKYCFIHHTILYIFFLKYETSLLQELNSGGDSALYFAIKHEQEEAVATLIEHGADVEHPASFMFNVSLLCNSKIGLPNRLLS